MTLDPQTMYLVAGCLFVLLPLNTWVISAAPRPAGVTLWSLGALAGGAGLLLMGLRSQVPDPVSYAAYSFLLLGILLFMQSLRIDLHRPWPAWLLALVPALHLLAVQIMLSLDGTDRWLAVTVRAFSLVSLLAMAWTAAVLARQERSYNAILICLGFVVPALAVTSNLIASWQGQSMLDDLRSGLPNLLVGLTGMVCALLTNLGYLGLMIERSHRQRLTLQANRLRQERRHALQRELARLERARTVGLMAHSLAHALLQPLAALRVHAETGARLCATEGPVDKALLQRLVQAASLQLGRVDEKVGLIRRFLQAAPLRPATPVDLCHCLRDVQPLVSQEAINHGVRLDWQLPALAVPVRVDALSVMQVLLQMVRHGVQVSAGRPGCEVRMVLVRSGQNVTVQVLDNGPPFPEEALKGPPLRASLASAPMPAPSWSPALLMAWRLMHEMGAHMVLHNRPAGQGVCVELRWPLADPT